MAAPLTPTPEPSSTRSTAVIENLRAHLARVRVEGGDEQDAIERDRLIAAAMSEEPFLMMAMTRAGEVQMTNSGASGSGQQRAKSEARDPSEATSRERKRRQEEEETDQRIRRAAAAAAARRSPTRQRVNEKGDAREKVEKKRKDVISSGSEDMDMDEGPSKADLARKLEQLEMFFDSARDVEQGDERPPPKSGEPAGAHHQAGPTREGSRRCKTVAPSA